MFIHVVEPHCRDLSKANNYFPFLVLAVLLNIVYQHITEPPLITENQLHSRQNTGVTFYILIM